EEFIDLYSDALFGMSAYSLSKFTSIISEKGGKEEFKKLILPAIKNSDIYKNIIKAKSKTDIISALKEADDAISTDSSKGIDFANEVNKYSSKVFVKKEDNNKDNNANNDKEKRNAYANENCYNKNVNLIKERVAKITTEILNKEADYSNYKINVSQEGLLTNAANIKRLYENICSVDGIRGSSDNFRNMKTSLEKLTELADKLASQKASVSIMNEYSKLSKDTIILAKKYIIEKTNINSDYARSRVDAVKQMIKELSVNSNSATKAHEELLEQKLKSFSSAKIVEYRHNKEKYEGPIKKGLVFRASKYRNMYIDNGPSNHPFMLNRSSVESIAVMALLANGMSYEDLISLETKPEITTMKNNMCETVIKKCNNPTPENLKWVAKMIIDGQIAASKVLDTEGAKIDLTNPNFEMTKEFVQLSTLSYYMFDTWQEMARCKPEVVAYANEAFMKVENYNKLREKMNPLRGLFNNVCDCKTRFIQHIEEYYNKGEDFSSYGTVVDDAFRLKFTKDIFKKEQQEYHKTNLEKAKEYGAFHGAEDNFLYSLAQEKIKRISDFLRDNHDLFDHFLPSLADGSFFSSVNYTVNYETGEFNIKGLEELYDYVHEAGKEIKRYNALTRLEKAEYKNDDEMIRDAAVAIVFTAVNLGVELPTNPKTNKAYDPYYYARAMASSESFRKSLMKKDNPNELISSKHIAEILDNPEKLNEIIKAVNQEKNPVQKEVQNKHQANNNMVK
ncbi:MAG: hypothetical protein K5656_00560, partial [Lachnospiraceae bacterium]|nr:hypothetical protein [Lachnospiraceae bacterium]